MAVRQVLLRRDLWASNHAHTQIDRVVSCVKVAARESLECQTILSVVLDVDPQSARHLSDLIEAFKRQQEEEGTETYGRLKDGVPSLHFLSMSVFQGAHYDPIFVIEANFDGSPAAFWGHMEATLADVLADAAMLQAPCGR